MSFLVVLTCLLPGSCTHSRDGCSCPHQYCLRSPLGIAMPEVSVLGELSCWHVAVPQLGFNGCMNDRESETPMAEFIKEHTELVGHGRQPGGGDSAPMCWFAVLGSTLTYHCEG